MRLELHFGLFPGCMFRQPKDLIADAMKIGYSGVQAIPIRGMTGYEEGIELFEDAWNPVDSLWQALRHLPCGSGAPSCINDWVVSPDLKTCRGIVTNLSNRGISEIHHGFDNPDIKLIEVSPGLDMTPYEIAEYCRQHPELGLVLDTSHIRRGYRSDEVREDSDRTDKPSPLGITIGEWESAIKKLAPFIRVIHVNPGDEDDRFLNSFLTSETGRLFEFILKQIDLPEITIVAEHRPKLFKGGLDQAKQMLREIKRSINYVVKST